MQDVVRRVRKWVDGLSARDDKEQIIQGVIDSIVGLLNLADEEEQLQVPEASVTHEERLRESLAMQLFITQPDAGAEWAWEQADQFMKLRKERNGSQG